MLSIDSYYSSYTIGQTTEARNVKRREIVILVIFACVLAAVNAGNFIRKQRLSRNYRLVVQAGKTKLSLNTAQTSDFEDLPGIGPVLAQRIVDYRENEGGYESLEELKRVRGIGENLYEKIVPYLRL